MSFALLFVNLFRFVSLHESLYHYQSLSLSLSLSLTHTHTLSGYTELMVHLHHDLDKPAPFSLYHHTHTVTYLFHTLLMYTHISWPIMANHYTSLSLSLSHIHTYTHKPNFVLLTEDVERYSDTLRRDDDNQTLEGVLHTSTRYLPKEFRGKLPEQEASSTSRHGVFFE